LFIPLDLSRLGLMDSTPDSVATSSIMIHACNNSSSTMTKRQKHSAPVAVGVAAPAPSPVAQSLAPALPPPDALESAMLNAGSSGGLVPFDLGVVPAPVTSDAPTIYERVKEKPTIAEISKANRIQQKKEGAKKKRKAKHMKMRLKASQSQRLAGAVLPPTEPNGAAATLLSALPVDPNGAEIPNAISSDSAAAAGTEQVAFGEQQPPADLYQDAWAKAEDEDADSISDMFD